MSYKQESEQRPPLPNQKSVMSQRSRVSSPVKMTSPTRSVQAKVFNEEEEQYKIRKTDAEKLLKIKEIRNIVLEKVSQHPNKRENAIAWEVPPIARLPRLRPASSEIRIKKSRGWITQF